ncbi:hypothetical protein WN944_000651 [Citrus x changshan-huyou]|uniref:Uncharacterized protein n=1 Tax=Citrus x changshan-huyou TaxID=2935761 RepID=A0AAP0MD97_9ROSI
MYFQDEEEQQQLRTVAHVSRFENQYTISNIVASVSRRLEERRRRNVVGNRKPSVSIFKLPSSLTGINYKYTQPEMVSIGPYHHGKDHLLEFEEYKWFFLEMMLLDGCFLIEILCHLGRDESDADLNFDDPIFTRPWLIPMLVRDIVKLETQLPLFVLKLLFSKSGCDETFIKLISEFFSLPVNSIAEREKYCPSTHSLQCVTQLRRSGIKIKPRKAERFLDIKYEKQVLQIPSITINDITSTVLINCVALEQCQERNIKYFSNHVSFMCCLISQPRDVALLGLDGVITNFSQDDQHVADLFNDLGKNTALNVRESYLWKVLHDVGAYYSSCWASMIRTYFSSPWSCILSVLCFCLANAYHGTICNVCFKLLP